MARYPHRRKPLNPLKLRAVLMPRPRYAETKHLHVVLLCIVSLVSSLSSFSLRAVLH